MKIRELLDEAGYRPRRDAYQRDYDSSRTGFGKQSRAYQADGGANDEYNTPEYDPSREHARKETSLYNIKVNGQVANPKPILGRSNALAWAKNAIANGEFDAKDAVLSPVHGMSETATAGGTSAGNVAVGAVYKNKPAKAAKNKNGTVKNALDMGANLLTGGSIKR